MKKCNKCNKDLPVTDFHKNKGRKDGLMGMCKPCNTSRVNEWLSDETNRDITKAREWLRRLKRHGITEEIFAAKLEEQGHVCGICKYAFDKYIIDHDHVCCDKTYGCAKCFRGVLCSQCNSALGLFKESKVSLQNAIEYLCP